MKVVCITSNWSITKPGKIHDSNRPVKGEIYEVMEIKDFPNYFLVDGFRSLYGKANFRAVDNTFGHVVTQNIEQQLELEQVATW
jgi:hypothetical protein